MQKILLVIGWVWPEPQSSAAGCHMISILRCFRDKGWRVVFSSAAQTTEFMVDLKQESIECQSIQLNCSSFDYFVKHLNPDIVLFDRFLIEEQFGWRVEQSCPHAIRILDTEDLQCLRHAREVALKNQYVLQQKDLFSELAKREIASILRCDLSLIISDFEMGLLTKTYKVDDALLIHLPFLLDLNKAPLETPSFSQRQHFVTIGNFRHPPNWDALLYLQEIWPLIRQTLPDAECHIYGAYASKKVMSLHHPETGFLIQGRADTAHAVLSQARICLAPLRYGAGIKGKLIDAMLANTPSVTTPIGSEGMQGDLPWPGFIVHSKESFADAAIQLYQNETLWLDCQQKIPQLLQTRYNKTTLSALLFDRIRYLEEHLENHRLNNFLGSMLLHHQMKSTQYLSKWIEEKNKK